MNAKQSIETVLAGLPGLLPTLEAGVEAMTVAALAWLAPTAAGAG